MHGRRFRFVQITSASHPSLSTKKIALIESGNIFAQPPTDGGYSNRVVALSPSSVSLLSQLGAWKHIEDSRKREFRRMHVWDAESTGEISFNSDKPIATIVENQRVQESIVKLLYNREKVEAVDLNGPRKQVELVSEQSISCDLLIGADGPNSKVRESAGIKAFGWAYDQSGVVATLDIKSDSNGTAWQRFLPTGPIALLPLSETKSSLVWSVPRQVAAKLTNLAQSDFIHLVNAAFNNNVQDVTYLLSQIQPDGSHAIDFADEFEWGSSRSSAKLVPVPLIVECGPRASFPLRLQHTETYTAPGVALIGYSRLNK
jgi:ubiquinone biosynthesis monooxygenase Coq6